jgi:hypothetical protein
MLCPFQYGFFDYNRLAGWILGLAFAQIDRNLAHDVLGLQAGAPFLNSARPQIERRKWARLPLAIPVFVRSRDRDGKESLEFATALNVSAGGMLVAVRKILPAVDQVQLEIPSAPVAAETLLPRASRDLRAKALRTTQADGFYLLGLKFTRPLLRHADSNGFRRRKEPALV